MRPEIYADLDQSQIRGREVMKINMSEIPPDGALLSSLGNFLEIAKRAKLTTDKKYGWLTFYLPPTQEDLELALSDAKADWDYSKQLYEAAEISKTEPEDYTRHRIRNWAAKEGLPLPWEA